MTRPAPRWLRVVRDFPRATSTGRFWCRADGESSANWRWLGRSAAHVAHWRSLKRRGVYDTRWTVLR